MGLDKFQKLNTIERFRVLFETNAQLRKTYRLRLKSGDSFKAIPTFHSADSAAIDKFLCQMPDGDIQAIPFEDIEEVRELKLQQDEGAFKREAVEELVRAHMKIEDPTSGAIWIRPEQPEVWLVEVIPSMNDDEDAGQPVFFRPGVSFQFPLALIGGNLKSLELALHQDKELARSVAQGTVLTGSGGDAAALVLTARRVSGT